MYFYAAWSFAQTNRDDIVILEKKLELTSDKSVMYPVLRLYSIHSAVEVRLDGKMLYSYGKERYAEGKVLGCGYHYVALPSDYAGKVLNITYIVAENNAFNGIQDLEISDQHQLSIDTFNRQHADLQLYSAIGVVKREDFPNDISVHIVCKEVDRRMYENKRSMKEQLSKRVMRH